MTQSIRKRSVYASSFHVAYDQGYEKPYYAEIIFDGKLKSDWKKMLSKLGFRQHPFDESVWCVDQTRDLQQKLRELDVYLREPTRKMKKSVLRKGRTAV